MTATVCLFANTLAYPQGGGQFWVFLNWAIGFQSLGCRVIWLEGVSPRQTVEKTRTLLATLKNRLAPYGLAESVAICYWSGAPLPRSLADHCLDLDAATESDLLVNQQYDLCREILRRFRRTVLLDIDPALLQVWMSSGLIEVATHDIYFTTGETVGRSEARFPSANVPWQYIPPCVAIERWPVCQGAEDASFTTVTHWYMNEWQVDENGEIYSNDKRTGFLPFLDLPRRTSQPLELSVCLDGDVHEQKELEDRGWRIRESWHVTSTPTDYQQYIQKSRGEFSCAKPSCVRYQNAWISDRTLCYLASGKPAIVQHTGPSRFLPDANGLFRFRDIEDAVRCLEIVASDYDRHCREARALAEELFDAKKVAANLLETAL